jgi:hypothetical protein
MADAPMPELDQMVERGDAGPLVAHRDVASTSTHRSVDEDVGDGVASERAEERMARLGRGHCEPVDPTPADQPLVHLGRLCGHEVLD